MDMATEVKLRPYQEKALKNCDGVIEIANNEMLIQGDYVTHRVENEELARQGSICGGHQACLVGSIYIAHGVKPWRESSGVDGWGVEARGVFMSTRPALQLTYDAFNRAAFETIGNPDEDYDLDRPDANWAEWFFETYLEGSSHNAIRRQVIGVANRAKELIREGVVT